MELNGRPRLGQEDGIHAPPFLREERNSQFYTSGSVAAGLGHVFVVPYFLALSPFPEAKYCRPFPLPSDYTSL